VRWGLLKSNIYGGRELKANSVEIRVRNFEGSSKFKRYSFEKRGCEHGGESGHL
jgi:hypothetical protein